MRLLSLYICLGLFAACSARAVVNLIEEEATFNSSLDSVLSRRSLQKRDVWLDCENENFRPLLQQALQDAIPILENMIAHLELLLDLYNPDGSGELRADKADQGGRTFDEHNAIATYSMFVSKIYWGPGDGRNPDGLDRARSTRNTAIALLAQYREYAAGTITPYNPNARKDVAIYCDQAEYLSTRDHLGRTWFQASGTVNGADGKWRLSQSDGVLDNVNGEESVWINRAAVCPLTGLPGETRFDGVPTLPGMKAHWFPAPGRIVEESITFCPRHFDAWIETERTRTQNRLHWRNMHVPIGSTPTADQQQLAQQLLALPEMASTAQLTGVKWLAKFVVQTMIHESTHAPSFLGAVPRLTDVRCNFEGSDDRRTTDIACLSRVAKGEQGEFANDVQPAGFLGHKDAEAFALYAMATWYNAVYWFRGFRPNAR